MGLFDSAEERAKKKKLKEEEKERKRKEFERIMASNPDVTIRTNNNTNTKMQKEQEKLKRKAEMERLRNAGRTVHPSEQPSYPSVPQYDSNVARCPKCGSTSITANKKGFSLAKGALGVAAVGAYGAIAAGHGKNKVIVTCLKCGHQWKPGK